MENNRTNHRANLMNEEDWKRYLHRKLSDGYYDEKNWRRYLIEYSKQRQSIGDGFGRSQVVACPCQKLNIKQEENIPHKIP